MPRRLGSWDWRRSWDCFSICSSTRTRRSTLPRLIEMFTVNPARLLQIEAGTLSPGAAADVTLIDPELEWTFDASASQSLSRNTPFDGWKLKGRAVRTIVRGETVWAL